MNKKIITSSLCAALLLSTALVANAQAKSYYGDHQGNYHSSGMQYHNFAGNLQLSEAEQAKYQELLAASEAKITPIFNELEDKGYELKKLYRADSPDLAAINALNEEISALKTTLFAEKEAFRLQLNKEFPDLATVHHSYTNKMDRQNMNGRHNNFNNI